MSRGIARSARQKGDHQPRTWPERTAHPYGSGRWLWRPSAASSSRWSHIPRGVADGRGDAPTAVSEPRRATTRPDGASIVTSTAPSAGAATLHDSTAHAPSAMRTPTGIPTSSATEDANDGGPFLPTLASASATGTAGALAGEVLSPRPLGARAADRPRPRTGLPARDDALSSRRDHGGVRPQTRARHARGPHDVGPPGRRSRHLHRVLAPPARAPHNRRHLEGRAAEPRRGFLAVLLHVALKSG